MITISPFLKGKYTDNSWSGKISWRIVNWKRKKNAIDEKLQSTWFSTMPAEEYILIDISPISCSPS